MTFEVYRFGNCIMRTEYPECIYKKDILKAMQKAGYSFKIDGKSASIKEITEIKDGNYE